MNRSWISRPVKHGLQGTLQIPGDKSVSHRALILGSLAQGRSHVRGFLESEDTRATADMFRAMGVQIDIPEAGQRIVHGVGVHGLKVPAATLDCGNSGTSMRLMAGLLAGQAFDSTLIGDESLNQRPMQRITVPLANMGAVLETDANGCPPLRIKGGQALSGRKHAPDVASAQVKSAILLAGLYADAPTEVQELRPTRDYTERMLAGFGANIEFTPGWVRLVPGNPLKAQDIVVPSDFSSAAFLIVAAAITPGSHLVLQQVGLNPRRTGLLDALRMMGADISLTHQREVAGETMADITICHAPLKGITVPTELVPDMIDEFPALFVAAATASGVTTVSGAAELRVKESDRISGMAHGLQAMGIEATETPDGMRIVGGHLQGGTVDSLGDHRLAMSFAAAGLVATAPVVIEDCANVAVSFPNFVELARTCGFDLSDD